MEQISLMPMTFINKFFNDNCPIKPKPALIEVNLINTEVQAFRGWEKISIVTCKYLMYGKSTIEKDKLTWLFPQDGIDLNSIKNSWLKERDYR